MFDPENVDELLVIVDLINDAIGAAPSRPESGEFALELMTDLARIFTERSEQELDHRSSNSFW